MEVNKPYIGKIANSLKKAQSQANGVHDPAQTECNQANIVHTILVRTKLQCWLWKGEYRGTQQFSRRETTHMT